MDCYSAESEFIASLDFLSPPVKRINSSRQALSSAYNTDVNDVHLLNGVQKQLIGLAPGLTLNTKPVKFSESSTSLILKKTTERQIQGNQYSVVSFPSLCQLEKNNYTLLKSEQTTNPSEKPLIKVTVIPKTDSIQVPKLFRRRRRTSTKIKSTSSNHENSIHTKNVFLIVLGQRKEKIYEIKTTGSAKLSSDDTPSKHEDIPIAELSNFKHLLQSLDMDKKKKKEKKAAVDTSDVQQTKEWKQFSECNNSTCVREPPESPKRSRVRIFGQFGISEDDKYVLRYGATVDDTEVMSDVAQLPRDFSPVIAETSYGTTEKPLVQQQDLCLQADYNNYELDMEKPPVTETVSKEAHGTQVNFNVQIATTQASFATFSDKKTQCSCCGNRSDNKTLKDCQSPMVVISVYPKSSPEDLMKSMLASAVNTRIAPPAPNKSDIRRNNKTPLRSRSPSPVKKVSRPKVPDDSKKGQVSEKRSPDRQKALKAIKDKIREKDKLKQESPRKLPLKSTNATQGSKNLQNITVSTATQVLKRTQGYTTSQATQVSDKKYQPANTANGTQTSAKRFKNDTTSSGTQYSSEYNATQCGDSFGGLQNIAPVKHLIDEAMVPKKYPVLRSPPTIILRTHVSIATQAPEVLYSTHATQVSRSDSLMNFSATQVAKPRPNVITPRMSTNQEKSIPTPPQDLKIEQNPRLILKTKAESGINKEQARAKKVLVETYTKKLTEQMYRHDYIPARFDNSKVTINIDGDGEYYNVLFDQDNMSTGLTIRKTLKDMGVPNCINESPLGSLLPLSDCVERGRFNSGNNSPTRCPSIVLCNKPSEDELRLLKHESRLTIRDSLEISHRREDKSTTQLADIVTRETEFSAPVKHFSGDDCSLSDPIARDKQIRELLGVDNLKANYSKACQSRCCDNNVEIPYQCIYQQRCKESQVTEISYGLHKLRPCFDSIRPKEKASVSVQCRKKKYKANFQKQNSVGENEGTDEKSAINQQLILNRNIQVFLQVEQFSKQKPIILSRKQYDKVKKTIQKTISIKKSHVKRSNLLLIKSSEISIGEVRIKQVKDPELSQKKAKDQTPEITENFRCEQAHSISFCCQPNYTHFDKNEGKSRSRKPTADVDMKGDYFSRETSDRDEAKLKKDKTKEEPEQQAICKPCAETFEEQDYRRVGKGNVYCKEQLFAKKDIHKLRPELKEERDAGVNKANVAGKERLISKKDMHKPHPELNEERDVGVNKANGAGKERLIAKKDMHKPHPELNEERDLGVNKANVSGKERLIAKKDMQKPHPELNEERDVGVNKANVSGKERLIAKKDMQKPHPELNEERDVGVNKANGAGKERLIAKKDMHKPHPELNEERDAAVNKANVSGKERLIAKKDIQKPHPELNEERDLGVNKANESGKERLIAKKDSFAACEYDSIEVNHSEVETFVLFNAEHNRANFEDAKETDDVALSRRTMSSVQLHYTSVAMKQLEYTSTDVEAISDSSLGHLNSFQTLFRGHRKSATPNLGTSAYSSFSEDGNNSENKCVKLEQQDFKPKKPFLRRLMSCLVMRSTGPPVKPPPELPSANTSINSYHISTSLAAVEVSSSIYDTTASFYSNHSIHPINSKIKRGFFSSVRGFLTNRKS